MARRGHVAGGRAELAAAGPEAVECRAGRLFGRPHRGPNHVTLLDQQAHQGSAHPARGPGDSDDHGRAPSWRGETRPRARLIGAPSTGRAGRAAARLAAISPE